MLKEEIGESVRNFILKNFLFDNSRPLRGNDSLLGTGIIDSTGVLELINFLQETYQVKFEDQDLIAENFDSVERIQSFVSSKLSPHH